MQDPAPFVLAVLPNSVLLSSSRTANVRPAASRVPAEIDPQEVVEAGIVRPEVPG